MYYAISIGRRRTKRRTEKMTKEKAAGILKWIAGETIKVVSVNMDDGQTFTVEQLQAIVAGGR